MQLNELKEDDYSTDAWVSMGQLEEGWHGGACQECNSATCLINETTKRSVCISANRYVNMMPCGTLAVPSSPAWSKLQAQLHQEAREYALAQEATQDHHGLEIWPHFDSQTRLVS